jgi:hypothetical protein
MVAQTVTLAAGQYSYGQIVNGNVPEEQMWNMKKYSPVIAVQEFQRL